MTISIRKCPGCKEERPETESLCLKCSWDLTQEPLSLPGQNNSISEVSTISPNARMCLNGHVLEDGDEMCFVQDCGAGAAEASSVEEIPQQNATVIDEWIIIDRVEDDCDFFESFIVERHGHKALLTYYCPDAQPDVSVYEILNRLPKEYVPELLAYGEWDGRRYEVTDLIPMPNLLDLLSDPIDLETIRQIVKSMGQILSFLAENELRHGNLRPENILIVGRDPIALMLTGFQYSRLSNFELDTVTQPVSAYYTAPEVIAGGISAASDWWSLGMVILQMLRKGQYFDGINEKAFRIHVVTRGISIPKAIDPSISLLLRGLLAQDPEQRWKYAEIQKWLNGEEVAAPSDIEIDELRSGPALDFQGHSYTCPKKYSLAAVEAADWDQAKELFLRGVVASWLDERKIDSKVVSGVRTVSSIDSISDDYKHALALMWMNPNLPLIYRGDIVTPKWLLENPNEGYEIISGPIISYLRQMNREPQLWELHDRLERALERAKLLEIDLDEDSFRILVLVSSRKNLERQWAMRRRQFPGSDHRGINSLIDRQKINDEELVILLSAKVEQYQSAEQILSNANSIASQVEVLLYSESDSSKWFEVSRREIYREIEDRTANYSKCGISRVDEWANDFRIQKRISLPRALVLLSVPKENWKEPDRLQYVSRILEFFEKKTVNQTQRGPLVRMVISNASTRVDLATVSGNKPTASSILDHIISRLDSPVNIDRTAFIENLDLERKFRRLAEDATTYKRDTGIDSLYLGFPFLIARGNSPEETKGSLKISPILLWPIKIEIEARDRVSIRFDIDREEVRLNPVLARIVGVEEAKIWEDVSNELLGRSTLRICDIVDAFGSIVEPRERALCTLPTKDYTVKLGVRQTVCSAVLFHAQFAGQALLEDLRQMQKETPTGSGLETVLKINKDPIVTFPVPKVSEIDRYFTMESDPSQEEAVFRARLSPGLLIEGPPGTGKSQTIVNIIGDCIGRNESVLVVCQKPAALEVIAKRLHAEGLRDRFFYITHVNKDRTPVLNSVRTQIEGIHQIRGAHRPGRVKRERDELADEIGKLESDINKHHAAVYAIDEVTGLSYRELLGELIELEDQEIRLIDIPELRNILGDLSQKQLNDVEESCSAIAGLWFRSSYERSPLIVLKVFSSDLVLVEEFTKIFHSFVDAEKIRDAISKSQDSFDVSDITPHKEWIRSHDALFEQLIWEKVTAWFDLFKSADKSEGQKIIEKIEGIKKSLSLLDKKQNEPGLSEKLVDVHAALMEEWLSLAMSISDLKSSAFNKIDYIKCKLDEINTRLNLLNLSMYDQAISKKLTSIQLMEIENWLLLYSKISLIKPNVFGQYKKLQKQLDDQKNFLQDVSHEQVNEKLSLKLIDVKTVTLTRWLTLSKKVLNKKTIIHTLNPMRFIRFYRIKRILLSLNEEPSLEMLSQLQILLKHEIELRPIRDTVVRIKKNIYQESNLSNLLFQSELFNSVNYMISDLSNIEMLHEKTSQFNDSFSFDVVSRVHKAAELERQIRPYRLDSLNILGQVYNDIDSADYCSPDDLISLIKRMIGDCLRVSEITKVLQDIGEDGSFSRVVQFKEAICLEKELRPLRNKIAKYFKILYQNSEMPSLSCLSDLVLVADRVITDLKLAQKGINALVACPRADQEVDTILMTGFPAYSNLITRYEEAFSRYQARANSLDILERLSPFFGDDFFGACKVNIIENRSNILALQLIGQSLGSLSAYQEFRLHVPELSKIVIKIFSIMRKKNSELKEYPLEKLDGIIRRIIAREARLAWKDRIDQKFPILRRTHKELTRKITLLKESDSKMRALNKKYLAFNLDTEKLAGQDEWENITRLRGPRSRRLREIVELGADMGLMQVRPVWLMNPETASQLLPLRIGIFDVIVFDEASQIPIENALPALYRAKRVVISGDEKQMPPTNVFAKRFSDDEEYSPDEEFDELMSEAEIEALEDTRNRKDIKDCSDLLALGKLVLPKTMLQIHYRSKFRELIAFSNAAFYGNELNVPVRHPESVIKSARPLEVVRVDGIYANQTNKAEADKVVEILAEKWLSPVRPSIGVVTFNAKQAELIRDALAERTEMDLAFRQALSQERERQQEGEDMSFFVKNVESVQGDERDMIIFSSTFGRDEKGKFRRQFGLLSQVGGERRLNVAVTRAREKVVIVTSLPINEISEALSKGSEPKNSRDYLQAYFDYASNASDGFLEAADKSLHRLVSGNSVTQSESSFGKDGFLISVEKFIKSLGFNPVSIKEGDAFGLDFAIEDAENKCFGIGIECDAHCHEILKAARAREVWRPKVLNKGIPYVHRVQSYDWYHRRVEEEGRLKEAIEIALGVTLERGSVA